MNLLAVLSPAGARRTLIHAAARQVPCPPASEPMACPG